MKFTDWLSSIGIDLTLMFAGMTGSILMASKRQKQNIKASVLGIMSGTLSANYLTQVAIDVFELEGRSQYGVAFLLGYFGLKGVEKCIEKFSKNGKAEDSFGPGL